MSAAAFQAVLAADIRPCAAKCVAMVMGWHCNAETGHAWPSMATLARECGMSERHAKRAVGTLKRLGVLVVVKASAGGAHRATTTYAFDLLRLQAVHAAMHHGANSDESSVTETGGNGGRGRTGDAGAPRAPVSPQGGRGRPLPRAPASPKRDERKKALPSSLSSKAHTHASAGDAAGGRVSSPSLRVVGRVASGPSATANSQQPLTRGSSQQPVAADDRAWRQTIDGCIAKGIKLGLGGWSHTVDGEQHGDYMRRVKWTFDMREQLAAKGRPAR